MEPNHIYQYSLLNALMSGISETGISPSTLISKGTLGLGTFTRMNGELLLLDSTLYRLQAEGHVSIIPPQSQKTEDQIPFATVINFHSEKSGPISLKDKSSIDAILDSWTGGKDSTKNLFIAYRIDGVFKRIKARTVQGAKEGEKLSDLGKSQFVDEYHDIRGTIVGFRSPENWSGFAVAGEHLHFIDEDRKKGGHVLEVETDEDNGDGKDGKVMMGLAISSDVHVQLPRSKAFNEAELKTDEGGIKEAEG